MKKLILFFLITFSSANAQFTQEWIARTNWGGSSGLSVTSMVIDDSNNVLVTGMSGRSYATVKYTSAGNEIWRAAYPGIFPEYDLFALAIDVDQSGNAYVTGRCQSLSGENTTLTLKYTRAGVLEWARRFNGTDAQYVEELGSALKVDKSGNIIVTGVSFENLLGRGDDEYWFYTIKYNPAGDTIWTRKFEGTVFAGYPSMTIDTSGNIYVSCRKPDSTFTIDYIYTIKYDSSGNVIWSGKFESLLKIQSEKDGINGGYLGDIAVDDSENVYIAAEKNGITILKYDSNGLLKWSQIIGGQNVAGIVVDHSGNTYVSAEYDSPPPRYEDYLTFKLNSNGQTVWSKTFNGVRNLYEHPSAIALDHMNNVYVTGTGFFAQDSTPDYCTVKYDSNGNLRGVASYDGPRHSYDRVGDIAIDRNNNVYVGGVSKGISTFDFTTIKYSTLTNVENNFSLNPERYSLSQNYPNPFNPVTHLGFGISDLGFVSLKVYDILGNEVATLVNEKKIPGNYQVEFNGSNFPSGVYYYKLVAGEFSEVRKMILLK